MFIGGMVSIRIVADYGGSLFHFTTKLYEATMFTYTII